ncbi:ankyrin repeat, PH and SEC7 domain containing protein secG-like [Scylla paramamosain]|uniref:ankyrin repeat, PH and SEC7 domain containing protein secG-like n=1 Tax=Scylla paramamosain TaxID=85552 RepID=UPI00308376F2
MRIEKVGGNRKGATVNCNNRIFYPPNTDLVFEVIPGYLRATHAPHPTMASNPHHHKEKFLEAIQHQPTAAHTPVHLASYGGHVEVLEQLAGAGWPLTARDSDGNTPMHSAAAGGRVTCVQWLVQRGGDTSMQNNAGHTPLDKAGLSIEGGGTTDWTPLMMAALNGHAHTVKALLDLRGNPLAMDSDGEAVYGGHVEVLEQLAGAGWPLTARDSDGDTPMHFAAWGGCAAAVQWLVQRGCDPLVQSKAGRTPLEFAVQHGRHEVESWLVKNCSGVVRRKTLRVQQVREWRGVHEHHHNTVLSMLVEGNEAAMANIPELDDGHTLSQDGLTPLHAAALCGAPSDAVEALLQRGVSPHVTTPDNMTPADLARQQGQDSVIKGLQRHHCVQQYGNPKFQLHKSI